MHILKMFTSVNGLSLPILISRCGIFPYVCLFLHFRVFCCELGNFFFLFFSTVFMIIPQNKDTRFFAANMTIYLISNSEILYYILQSNIFHYDFLPLRNSLSSIRSLTNIKTYINKVVLQYSICLIYQEWIWGHGVR